MGDAEVTMPGMSGIFVLSTPSNFHEVGVNCAGVANKILKMCLTPYNDVVFSGNFRREAGALGADDNLRRSCTISANLK